MSSFTTLLGEDPLVPEPRSRGWRSLLLITLGTVIVGVLAWTLTREASPTESSPEPTHTRLHADPVTLDRFEGHEGRIYYPRLLPVGLYLCEQQLGRPTLGNRFCSDDDEDLWVEVAIRIVVGSPPSGRPIETLSDAVMVTEGNPIEIRVAVSDEFSLIVTASGLSADQVVAIAQSIPVVGDKPAILGKDELPIAELDAAFIAELLDHTPDDVYVDQSGSYLIAKTPQGDGLWADPISGVPIWDLIVGTIDATLDTSGPRMMVYGTREGDNVRLILWFQRGRLWQLTGNDDYEVMLQLARRIESKLSAAP